MVNDSVSRGQPHNWGIDDQLARMFDEMATLATRKQQYRNLYKYMQEKYCNHPNASVWLKVIENHAKAIDSRLEQLENRVLLGVAA